MRISDWSSDVCSSDLLQTVRATMLDELGKLSVTAARARGIPEFKLILKYPARLAINPVVSTMGFDGNRIFSELTIVELEIGRASCRARVCQVRVDLGGGLIIKKKKI